MQSIGSALGLIFCAVVTVCCTDGSSGKVQNPSPNKSQAPAVVPSSSPDPTSSSINAASNDICKDVQKNAGLASGDFAGLLQRLCGAGAIDLLKAKAYKGSGEPDLGAVATEQAGGKTDLKTTSLMMAQVPAKSYFNLIRLQVSKPDDFKAQGFETDPDVTYQILSNGTDRVVYSYKNTAEAPEIVVSYDAEANFFDLGTGRSFVVTTKVTNAKESVVSFRGISVIHSASASPNIVEVYSISDQIYDNNNDHSTAVTKFKRQGAVQTKRSYRNSANASKADAFFK